MHPHDARMHTRARWCLNSSICAQSTVCRRRGSSHGRRCPAAAGGKGNDGGRHMTCSTAQMPAESEEKQRAKGKRQIA
eukprot:4569500-Amphidinium_carterae.2